MFLASFLCACTDLTTRVRLYASSAAKSCNTCAGNCSDATQASISGSPQLQYSCCFPVDAKLSGHHEPDVPKSYRIVFPWQPDMMVWDPNQIQWGTASDLRALKNMRLNEECQCAPRHKRTLLRKRSWTARPLHTGFSTAAVILI